MEYRTPENSCVSDRAGRGGDNSSPGLCGIGNSQTDGLVEEFECESSLGEEEGDEKPGNFVLLQGGHQISPTKIVDSKRRYLGRLVARRLDLLIELARYHRGDIGGEEREILDELEAIGRAEEVVRRLNFD